MLLPLHEVELFFKLHLELLYFVNRQLNVLPQPVASAEAIRSLTPADRQALIAALVKNIGLIQPFVEQNPARLSVEELDIVRSWKHLISGQFYILRDLKKYTVFLPAGASAIAYGVTSLSQEIVSFGATNLPRLVATVLLPFKGKLIYDGLMSTYNMSFGPGIRRTLDEDYRVAKERYGIVTTLPAPPSLPVPPSLSAAPLTKGIRTKVASPPKPTPKDATAEALTAIVALIDIFCREHLSDEYADLCRRLAEKLARKRPSPLASGQSNNWACGIVRVIALFNYLGDKKLPRPLHVNTIDGAFGVRQATGQRVSASIRKLLKLGELNTDWVLPDRENQNPMVAWQRSAAQLNTLVNQLIKLKKT